MVQRPAAASIEGTPIRLGVSGCLVGEEVRFNGGHARKSFITDTLGQFVDYTTVCPEVEVGMGVPRPTVRLQQIGERIHLVDPKHGVDWTAAMEELSRARTSMVDDGDLSGFILKKGSPTCGPGGVKLYRDRGQSRAGVGVFASELRRRYPHLPIEDEGRLNDPGLRENFIERVFAYRRLRNVFRPRWAYGDIVAFHTREKMLLLSHDERSYRSLGRLVATGKQLPRPAFAGQYMEGFMTALEHKATVRRNVNVLQHIAGHFKRVADEETRAELAGLIEDYRNRLVPLVVPITLIRHLVRRHRVELLAGQTYLEPHPKELMLRNHA